MTQQQSEQQEQRVWQVSYRISFAELLQAKVGAAYVLRVVLADLEEEIRRTMPPVEIGSKKFERDFRVATRIQTWPTPFIEREEGPYAGETGREEQGLVGELQRDGLVVTMTAHTTGDSSK